MVPKQLLVTPRLLSLDVLGWSYDTAELSSRTKERGGTNQILQSLQKRDEGPIVLHGKIQPEFVAFHGASLYTIAHKACGHVVVAQTTRVEPVFEGGAGAIVLEWATIPETSKRWDLVIASATPGLHREP